MTDADLAIIIAAGGSVAAGAWQTLRGVASFLTPLLERMIAATEATSAGVGNNTVILTDLRAAKDRAAQEFHAFTDDHAEAKTRAFENHARLEDLAKRALTLCEQILVEVRKP